MRTWQLVAYKAISSVVNAGNVKIPDNFSVNYRYAFFKGEIMVSFQVQTDHAGNQEGIIIYSGDSRTFLTKDEAGMLAQFIQNARAKYWKRFKLNSLLPSSNLDLTHDCTQTKP